MPVVLRIAFRNLREHRSKTIIVGTIIAIGVAILLIGNSMMDTLKAGMRTAFIENYVGDIMITGGTSSSLSVFGYTVSTGNEEFPTIPKYGAVYNHVVGLPNVTATASEVIGYGMISVGENAQLENGTFGIFWGIEPANYREMFPSNMKILSGSYLAPGETGIMLSRKTVDALSKSLGVTVNAGDKLMVNGIGSAGFRIREVPLIGIFALPNSNQAMDAIGFMDVQTLRSLNGMVLATPDTIRIASADTALLGAANPDELFAQAGAGGGMVDATAGTANGTGAGTAAAGSAGSAGAGTDQGDIFDILGSGGGASRPPVDSGAWSFLLIRLKDSAGAPATIAALNAYFAKNGIAAHAADWLAASGPAGAFAYGFQAAFNGLIVIIAVVAVIIIMNTLVISVIERTQEIGMMRALGAQRSFVRRMFLLETMSISVVFGAIGLAAGSAVVGVLGALGVRTTNSFLQMVLGGGVFHPLISGTSFLTAAIVIIGIGLISSIYPVMVALRIQPVRAIQSE